MSQEPDQIAAFAEHLIANPELSGKIDAQLESGIALGKVVAFAEQHGFVFSPEDLAAALRQQAEISRDLSDAQLEAVSGGAASSEGDEVIFSIVYRAAGENLSAALGQSRRFLS